MITIYNTLLGCTTQICKTKQPHLLAQVFKPAAPFAALCLLASPWTPSWLDIGLATATMLTCMSQQFHAWAHMKASDLHPAVKQLQVRTSG